MLRRRLSLPSPVTMATATARAVPHADAPQAVARAPAVVAAVVILRRGDLVLGPPAPSVAAGAPEAAGKGRHRGNLVPARNRGNLVPFPTPSVAHPGTSQEARLLVRPGPLRPALLPGTLTC